MKRKKTMSIFSNRTMGYKAGVFLLFFSYFVFILGCATSYWASAYFVIHHQGTYTYVNVQEGLWMFCETNFKNRACATFGVSGLAAWLHVVRLLECLSAMGLTTACVYALYTNFCRLQAGPFSRFLEMCAAISGIIGFLGCIVYAGKFNNRTDEQEQRVIGTEMTVIHKDYTLMFAFYLVFGGSILSVVTAIVIGVFNKDPFKYNLLGTLVKRVSEVFLRTTTSITERRGQDQGQGQVCPADGGDQVHHPLYGQSQPNGEPQPVTVGYSEA